MQREQKMACAPLLAAVLLIFGLPDLRQDFAAPLGECARNFPGGDAAGESFV